MAPVLMETTGEVWLKEPRLHEEAFGPGGVVVECRDLDEAVACVKSIEGSLTGTIHAGQHESPQALSRVMRSLESNVGRVIVNGREARATEANFAAWEIELDAGDSAALKVSAHAEDGTGNVEKRPHVRSARLDGTR